MGDWWLANRTHPGPRSVSPQRGYPPAWTPTGSSQQENVHRWPAWLSAVIWLVASPVIAWTLAVVPSQRGDSSVEPVIGQLAVPAAGIALALGLLVAVITAVRLQRGVPPQRQTPQQRARRLTRRETATAGAVALGTAALAWLAAWADIEPGVDAIATATIGLLFGPAVIVAALTARRVETDSGAAVSFGELLRALFRGDRLGSRSLAAGREASR